MALYQCFEGFVVGLQLFLTRLVTRLGLFCIPSSGTLVTPWFSNIRRTDREKLVLSLHRHG